MRLFLFLMMLPMMAFADCKLRQTNNITLLDANLSPFVIRDYQGFIQPTWNKRLVDYRLQLTSAGANCKNKSFTGIANLTITNISGGVSTVSTYQETFVGGISSLHTFAWHGAGLNSLRFDVSDKSGAVSYIAPTFNVIVPRDVIIYEHELF